MDKRALRDAFATLLRQEIALLTSAAMRAHDAATHEENVPKSKYETLALETSYIAQGQANRAQELKDNLIRLENMEILEFPRGSSVAASALVTIEDSVGRQRTLFVCPGGGGKQLNHEGVEVTIVTMDAPLTQAMLGLEEDDEFQVNNREYVILEIL